MSKRQGSPTARLHALSEFLRSRLSMGQLPDWYQVRGFIDELREIQSDVAELEAPLVTAEMPPLPTAQAAGGAA